MRLSPLYQLQTVKVSEEIGLSKSFSHTWPSSLPSAKWDPYKLWKTSAVDTSKLLPRSSLKKRLLFFESKTSALPGLPCFDKDSNGQRHHNSATTMVKAKRR